MIREFVPIARAIIGVKNLTILGDYFVIANGTSTTHTKTLADEVEYQMTKLGIEPLHREGRGNGSNWIVLDYNDIIMCSIRKPEHSTSWNGFGQTAKRWM